MINVAYSLVDADRLCQTILEWQTSSESSSIDWEAISVLMNSNREGVTVDAQHCHRIWKHLAYGEHFQESGEGKLELPDSDDVSSCVYFSLSDKTALD
jgi:hypothetical protein